MNDSAVWGPQFWFVLHRVAFNYPLHPNKVTKKKYYDTIMNIPLFIPNPEMGNTFGKLLDSYPVTPYLDSRQSFIKWTHYIHNRVNEKLGKPTLNYADFISMYTCSKPLKSEGGLVNVLKKLAGGNKNAIVVSILLIIIAGIYKLL